MRALPRSEMAAFLEGRRAVAKPESAASETQPPPTAPPAAPLSVVPYSSGPDPAAVDRDTSAATPAKRHKVAGAEEGAIVPDTPCRDGHLSPGVALRLAQSCRKSPAMSDAASIAALSPAGADDGGYGSPSATVRRQQNTADAAEEERLLSTAQAAATKVFEHVRRVAKDRLHRR